MTSKARKSNGKGKAAVKARPKVKAKAPPRVRNRAKASAAKVAAATLVKAEPLPPVRDPAEMQMQFALGMAVNQAHHARSCGLPPDVVARAFIRAAAMVAEAFHFPLPDPAVEAQEGLAQQRRFQEQQQTARQPAAGQC